MLEKNPADRPTLLQIQEHRWCRAKCRSGSREIIITSISGDETVYSNFEEYIGRSLSPELEPTKSDITLKPIRKKTQTKSLVSDNIIAGRNAGLNVDHLNLFNRRTTFAVSMPAIIALMVKGLPAVTSVKGSCLTIIAFSVVGGATNSFSPIAPFFLVLFKNILPCLVNK